MGAEEEARGVEKNHGMENGGDLITQTISKMVKSHSSFIRSSVWLELEVCA